MGSGHQARPQEEQRGRVAPRGARGLAGRRRQALLLNLQGRRANQRHRQEHHRLRRVRRPGRHRPATAPRSRVAPREHPSEVLSRRRVTRRCSSSTPENSRVARHGSSSADWVGLSRRAGRTPLRQGHQSPTTAFIRSSRASGPGARLRDGLDQQNVHPSGGRAWRRVEVMILESTRNGAASRSA